MDWRIGLVVLVVVMILAAAQWLRVRRLNSYHHVINSFNEQAAEEERASANLSLSAMDAEFARGVAWGYRRAAMELNHHLLDGPKIVYVDDRLVTGSQSSNVTTADAARADCQNQAATNAVVGRDEGEGG